MPSAQPLTLKAVLSHIAQHGPLPGGLYICFRTQPAGLSLRMKNEYPDMITIVLENQFSNLVVDDDGFHVTLAFHGKRERIRVPWNSVVAVERRLPGGTA